MSMAQANLTWPVRVGVKVIGTALPLPYTQPAGAL
jgi:hypothetical protein